MPFKIIVFVFSVILFSSSIHAAKTYDFATRNPGIDAFAYDGINFTKQPSDNISPTRAYSGSEYTKVSKNDNTNNIIRTSQNNAYPMVRYVFELDEAEADIQRLDFFWNGKGINDKHNQGDGVVLYLWNYSSNGYVVIAHSGNTTAEVDLTHTITANIAHYIDENNNNKITLLVVSNDNVKGKRDNKIRTDYVSVKVESNPTPKTRIFSPADGILGGEKVSNNFEIGVQGNRGGENNWPKSEGPEHLIDDVGQKYLNFGELNTGAIITPAIGCSVVDSIQFWTANDNESRDPASYKLYGTNTSISDTSNPLSSFTLLAEGPLALPSSRNSGGNSGLLDTNSQTIQFTNSASYSSYLLYFPTVKTERSANSMQLGEVQVFGTARRCATPVLEYRFDEASWDGTADEVDDNSNTGLDGYAVGNANTVPISEGKVCRAGAFDGSGDYIDVSGISSHLNSTASLSFWIKTNQSGSNTAWQAPGILGIEESGGVDDIFWGYLDQTGHIRMQKGDTSPAISTSDIRGSDWRHIVLTRDSGSGEVQIFVDGEREDSSISDKNDVGNVFSSIGRIENNDTSPSFMGQLDELLVFDSVISASEVRSIYTNQSNGDNYDGTARTCPLEPSKIDHYQIIHDGQGLTCEAEDITIKACTNSYDGSCTLSSENVTLDVTATGPGSRSSTETVNLVAGIGTASIAYTFDDPTILSLSSAGTSATVCVNGSSTSCALVFANAGFRFLSGTGNSGTIANQVAGVEFNDTLKIQAVKDNNGVCEGLFINAKSVKLSQQNVAPTGTGGLNFNVAGNPIAKHPSVTDTTLTFGADSIALLPNPVYYDAGNIRLHAKYDDGTLALSGSSNTFWVRPDRLAVIAKSSSVNLDGATATATTTHKAGENFDLIVSAYNANNIITRNYVPGQIQLKLERTGPTLTGSVDGGFSYASGSTLQSSINPAFTNVNLTSFVTGKSTYDRATYSEVGLLKLDVQDSNYGSIGIVVPAAEINIGRFTPDYFKQTIAENGHLSATCSAGTQFAYSGQTTESDASIGAISYLVNPVLAITAYNNQGDVTENYQGDFMKLAASGINIVSPTLDEIATGVNGNHLPLNANMSDQGTLGVNDFTVSPTVALPKGVLHYQFSDNDNFSYSRSDNALVAPFTADIDFTIASINDSDNVNLGAGMTVDASPTGVEVRFGRLVLQNSFGPEGTDLTQPLQVEHFDGSVFTVSNDNNCLSYDDEDLSSSPDVDTRGGSGTFVSGKTRAIQLDAGDADSHGNIHVSYDTYDWLEFDWDNITGYEDPSAIATFGLFRGNDRVIYRRVIN